VIALGPRHPIGPAGLRMVNSLPRAAPLRTVVLGMPNSEKRPLLLLRVLAELGAGRIHEAFIPSEKNFFVDGETEGLAITVNPVPDVVDTVIHELLHRLYPQWSERYIKNRTSYLMKRMTDEEVQLFYEEYQRRKK
jgi:hypothetical protein